VFFALVFLFLKITIMSIPLAWIAQIVEKKVVGVKSAFGDAYLSCCLSILSVYAVTNLIYIMLYYEHWLFHDLVSVLSAAVCFLLVFRGILKHRWWQCAILSATSTIPLYISISLLHYIGVDL